MPPRPHQCLLHQILGPLPITADQPQRVREQRVTVLFAQRPHEFFVGNAHGSSLQCPHVHARPWAGSYPRSRTAVASAVQGRQVTYLRGHLRQPGTEALADVVISSSGAAIAITIRRSGSRSAITDHDCAQPTPLAILAELQLHATALADGEVGLQRLRANRASSGCRAACPPPARNAGAPPAASWPAGPCPARSRGRRRRNPGRDLPDRGNADPRRPRSARSGR